MTDYTPKTDAELKQLAQDWLAGTIFTDRQYDEHELMLGFMPLAMMSGDEITALGERLGDGGLIYEHVGKAGPTGINGKPVFFSMRYLDTSDTERLLALVKKIKAAIDSV